VEKNTSKRGDRGARLCKEEKEGEERGLIKDLKRHAQLAVRRISMIRRAQSARRIRRRRRGEV